LFECSGRILPPSTLKTPIMLLKTAGFGRPLVLPGHTIPSRGQGFSWHVAHRIAIDHCSRRTQPREVDESTEGRGETDAGYDHTL
jgi:hypothetical protein